MAPFRLYYMSVNGIIFEIVFLKTLKFAVLLSTIDSFPIQDVNL